MKKITVHCTLFIAFLLTALPSLSWAALPVKIDKNLDMIRIGRNIEHYTDITLLKTIDDITSKDISWTQSADRTLFFGFQKAAHWFRFTVEAGADAPRYWYLMTRRHYYDNIDLYVSKPGGGYSVRETGDLLPFNTRDLSDRHFTFVVKQDEPVKTVYLRIQSRGSVYLEPIIVSLTRYLRLRSRSTALLWILQGMLILIFISNLIIFFDSRDRNYLYFSGAIISITYFTMVLNGFAYQHLWPGSPWWANASVPLSTSLMLLANSIFPMRFLEMKERLPWGKYLLTGTAVAAGLCAVLSFTGPYEMTVRLLAMLVVITALSLLVPSLILAASGFRQARFYLGGFSFFILGGMIYTLELLEVIPALSLSYWTFQLGIVFFAMILSFGLIDKLNEMRKALAAANQSLEAKVAARTSELSDTNRALQEEVRERKETEKALRAALEEKTVLLKEVHHRVKNNLNIVKSLLSLQEDTVDDARIRLLLQDAQNRIRSISIVHEKLYGSASLSRIGLEEYISELLDEIMESYGGGIGRIRLETDVENLAIDIEQAIPLGIMINEVITNSMKHAFPDGEGGIIHLAMKKNKGNDCTLLIKDNGVGIPGDMDFDKVRGIGLQLIRELAKQLKGTIFLTREKGTTFEMNFPCDVTE